MIIFLFWQGAGTDDRTLIRVVVTRAEVDMVQIKQEFQKMYHKTLEDFIRVRSCLLFYHFYVTDPCL